MRYGYKRTALRDHKRHSEDNDKVSQKGGEDSGGYGKPGGESVQRGQTDV